MIEPTETETKEILDNFINIMENIATEIKEKPEQVLNSPVSTPVSRIDETLAARQPNLRWSGG